MKKIKLHNGLFSLIDDEDYELISKYKWRANPYGKNKWRAVTTIKGKNILMHRLIMNFPKEIDHIDGDGLNNIKANLRSCTRSQNKMNVGKFNGQYSSSFKGVSKAKGRNGWSAYTHLNGKSIFIGTYPTETMAAKAYNNFAINNHREFARLNELPKTKN